MGSSVPLLLGRSSSSHVLPRELKVARSRRSASIPLAASESKGTRRNLPADGREHLCGVAALAGEFEHVAAVGEVTKPMNCAGRHVHKRAGWAYRGLAGAGELHFPRDDVERLVPV